MKILSIETSADETSISIVDFADSGSLSVLAHIINTQIEMHKEYGGIYPAIAKREHARNVTPLLEEALKKAALWSPGTENLPKEKSQELRALLEREPEMTNELLSLLDSIERPDIDYVAVTNGPGLEPALWIGINFAKALGVAWDIPALPVNHMEGHIASALIPEGAEEQASLHPFEFPALALLVSGGHTELVVINEIGDYKKIGQTRDDAVGEAFDKTARLLGLPYPGGPEISKLAERSRTSLERSSTSLSLPRPMIDTDDYDFSFSGLKTAVRTLVEKQPKLTKQIKANIAKEFQNAAIDVLVSKTRKATEVFGIKTLIIGGGVSANKQLRETFSELLAREYPDIKLLLPNSNVTGDNALMIAIAGYLKIKSSDRIESTATFGAEGNLSL